MNPTENNLSQGNGVGGYFYGAVSIGATIYVVVYSPGPDMSSYWYTEGAAASIGLGPLHSRQ